MSESRRFRFRSFMRRVSVLVTLVMLCMLLPAGPAVFHVCDANLEARHARGVFCRRYELSLAKTP